MTFYKNNEERLLAKAIDCIYNNYVGSTENAIEDGEEYNTFSEEQLIKWIIKDILECDDLLEVEDSWEVIEPKHIRFIGKKRVAEIVEHRVQLRHTTKWSWEK